jgi:hypothetical protein
MDGKLAGGMIGIIFLVLCIGFLSALPTPRQASAHPFLAPQTASVGAVYVHGDGTITR